MTTPVRPAATVVVLRPRSPDDPQPELYMLRRSSKSAFMPDALVFPGGRVEDDDFGAGEGGADVGEDRAYAQAARRESLEEASLDVKLEQLRWFDTWKTPSGESPRRFLARFYLTTIDASEGHDAIADGLETRAGRWASAAAILDQWRAEQVDLPPPTLSILIGLADGQWRSWLSRAPEQVRAPILPKIAPAEGTVHIVMPHDPEYRDLPGDTGPVPERVHALPRRFARVGKRWVPLTLVLGIGLGIAGCKGKDAATGGDNQADTTPATTEAADTAASEAGEQADAGEAPTAADGSELDRLLAWLSPEPLAVAYDRLDRRLDPAVVSAVFGIPMAAADLLEEREILDEGLDIVFDDAAEPENWLGTSSLAFTVALSKTPYFVRPMTKPAAEVAPLLELGGFTRNSGDEADIWLPSGSFPWRIALLDGDVAAFIPVDVPGTGLEPLLAAKQPADADTGETEGEAAPAGPSGGEIVEAELRKGLSQDPLLELVLIASGPLLQVDIKQTIAQVQFGLRRVPGSGTSTGYEGQVHLTPTADPDECANDLRARKHPEENQQVQALVGQVQFEVVEGGVLGGLAIGPDQLKHFLAR